MSQIDPNSEPLAGANQLDAADGAGAVNSGNLTLAEINSFLGKDFKDTESALKSFKETYNFVGKRQPPVEPTIAPPVQQDSNLSSELKSLREDLFYTQNPQYQEHRALISQMGGNPAEVVNSPVFKGVFEKVKVANEAEESRSIVSSSNKIAANPSVISNAVEAVNKQGASAQQVADALAAGITAELNG